MSSSQPPKKSGGGWGSLLSGAVANLESRLDTILAEDADASARQRAGEAALENAGRQRTNSGNLAPPTRASAAGSREGSRTRVNDRLAERLAKATAAKKAAGGAEGVVSGVPGRVASPAHDVSARTSGESVRASGEVPRSVPAVEIPAESAGEAVSQEGSKVDSGGKEVEAASTLLTSTLPINPAKELADDSARPSTEVSGDGTSARVSLELSNGHAQPPLDASAMASEMAQMRADHAAAEKQRQEEMHAYLEKIDALQAKLKYLANETVAAAKAANAESSEEARLSEKDERIALLMEEGEKLSKTELRHMQTIKKLRSAASEKEKAAGEASKKLERAGTVEAELGQKLKRAEAAERQANERARQMAGMEKQVEELRVERENASELIRNLTAQLKEEKAWADRAEKEATRQAAEGSRERIAELENEVEDAQIERKLALDRAAADTKRMQAEMEQQRDRFAAREGSLKDEIAALEGRVEAMRSRAEEAFSSPDVGGGEGSVGLLRQVETLQSQYSHAKANWESMEAALTARLSALEAERDDAVKRETEGRKRARDATLGRRRVEEELETKLEEAKALQMDIKGLREEVQGMHKRLGAAESALSEAKAEAEGQRKVWEVELGQRIEEEKAKWARSNQPRNDSPATSGRKASVVDMAGMHPAPTPTTRRQPNRLTSHDLAALHTHHNNNNNADGRPVSRRSSAMPHSSISPAMSRQESLLSLGSPANTMPPTPSIEIGDPHRETSSTHSGDRTVNELMSTSTTHAGPSVQLVSRLSTTVRRLEAEKAAFQDELKRLSSQRDEARDEVVELMREVEGVRADGKRLGHLEEKGRRYEAVLEMLGEKEEEIEELRGDVKEMKRMYRELVERKMPAG